MNQPPMWDYVGPGPRHVGRSARLFRPDRNAEHDSPVVADVPHWCLSQSAHSNRRGAARVDTCLLRSAPGIEEGDVVVVERCRLLHGVQVLFLLLGTLRGGLAFWQGIDEPRACVYYIQAGAHAA